MPAVSGARARHAGEIDAQWDHPPLARSADPLSEELIPYRAADGDEAVRSTAQPAFDRQEAPRHEGRKVPIKHMAVERVHEHQPLSRSAPGPGPVVEQAGQPSERPSLGHVGV